MAASANRSPSSRASASDKKLFALGRYKIIDELGVGGMATVFLGRMDGPGGFQKWVAIKRIHPHLVEEDVFVDMFLDEARVVARINHPNVAQVFDIGKDDATYWLAMEYLHGEPVRELVRRFSGAGMPPELAARVCSDAAEGLHAAHELRGKNGQPLGLVHRDVSPHNLFVTFDGLTKVVDFGIAKVSERLAATRAGTLKGKLAYMSPEQARGKEVDRRTDIFALGIVLWEITTGRRLFRTDSDIETLARVDACVVPVPSSLVADYPAELEAIVLRALSKDKEARFRTALDFSRALRTFLIRRGALVGAEDVAAYMCSLVPDSLTRSDARLAWASEVTNISTLHDAEDRTPLATRSSTAPPPAPAAHEAYDEDSLPTMIASRSPALQAALVPQRTPHSEPLRSEPPRDSRVPGSAVPPARVSLPAPAVNRTALVAVAVGAALSVVAVGLLLALLFR